MTATERKLVREIINKEGLHEAMTLFTYESIEDQAFHTYRTNYLAAGNPDEAYEEAVILMSYLGVYI